LLDRISVGEGTSDAAAKGRKFSSGYDVTYGYGAYAKPDKPVTQMTLDEIDALQREMIRNKSGSSVVGRYQIKRETLQELRGKLGLSGDEVFDAALQDQLGEALLNRRGLEEYRSGRLPADKFQNLLAQEWSSIANYDTGKSHYGDPVGTTTEEIQAAIAGLKKR